jgi:hypothetical protein
MSSPAIIKSELGWSALMIISLISLSNCTPAEQCEELHALPDSVAIAVLGDSMFNRFVWNCGGVPAELSLMLGEEVADYSLWGVNMTGGTYKDVYGQYDTAKQEMPGMTSVVFDGGSNDIASECTEAERPECLEDVQTLLDEIGQLIDQMVGDGRNTIIYVGYYQLAGYFADWWPATNSLMDQIDPLCVDKGCIFLDLRPVFEGHPEWIDYDGVHLSLEGSIAVANEIHSTLMGQCSCAGWVDGECGGGSCTDDTLEQTRTCTPPGCLAESQCVADASCETCNCDVWQDGQCGGGSCTADTREQTRSCTPPGCLAESQCVADASCEACNCDVWQDGQCGGGSCTADTREQTRTCTPPGCLAESQCVADPTC